MVDENVRIVFSEPGKRIDASLALILSERGITRSRVRRLIDEGKVLLNGEVPKASEAVSRGDVAMVKLPSENNEEILPLNLPLKVRYEDRDLFVIEKPANMVTHPAHGHHGDTLVNVLLSLGLPLSEYQGKARAGIVHRLDKETSGLMVIAKNETAHAFLSKQFAERSVRKEYLALIWGTLPKDELEVSNYLGRDPKNRKKIAVLRSGRQAVTRFRELERMKHISLVRAMPRTGRTHQIRVHLACLKHPIVGDSLYGGHPERGVPSDKIKNALKSSNRFFLHASKLSFEDREGRRVEVESELPEDFIDFMEIVRQNG